MTQGTPRTTRTIVVLAPPDPRRLARWVDLSDFDGDRVEVVTETAPSALHDRLRRLERIDRVVDARVGDEQRQWRRWLTCFFHVTPGGAWVTLQRPTGSGLMAAKLTDLRERASRRQLRRRWREPERAIADVVLEDGAVTITKQGTHLLKLRDAEATDVLRARAPALRTTELEQVPGGTIEVAGRVTSHGFESEAFAAPIVYPPLHLRRYEGPITLVEGSVALHQSTLLPDTFRWHLQDVPENKRLVDIDAHWARTRRPEPPQRHLEGSYYYLDYKNPGHYGHLMTEAVSRLWGWDAAKADDPSLRLLCRRAPRHDEDPARRPELTLLPAYGIAPSDIVWVDDNVTVDSLVGLTPMWHNKAPYSAHPGITRVWDRLRTGLPAAAVPPRDRIFVTRRQGNRPCHNLEEVERLFADHGFDVVDPGVMTIPEQAATFARARTVAGFGGTGMFNLAFAHRLETLIVLNHTAYDARNEHLIAAVLGAETHYLWSEPDHPHPPGGWEYDAFQSSWTYDVDANRAVLDDLLARLR